jgi:hypothetical protein
MAGVTVTKTDDKGKPENEELEFEFKKDNNGEVKASVKSRTKKPQGKWGDPIELKLPGAQFGEKASTKTNAGFTDGTTTIYDKNGSIAVEVHCPHKDDKTNKPSIVFNGTEYHINHADQDKLVDELKALKLPKKP